MLPSITGVTWDDMDEWTPNMNFAENEVNILEQLAKRQTRTTPDFIDLKLQNEIPVFVYGTLKQGGLYHEILQHAAYLGRGITADSRYVMDETSSFPVVFDVPADDKTLKDRRGKIVGEVYIVDPLIMLRLDQLEGNGSMYTRRQSWIKMMDQQNSGVIPTIGAWMYCGNRKYFDKDYLHKVTATWDGRHRRYDWDCTETTVYAA
jgi:gamma-glutamylcyclotransferase (GGCT)/AIG2-like uncharacterized protein YtfP